MLTVYEMSVYDGEERTVFDYEGRQHIVVNTLFEKSGSYYIMKGFKEPQPVGNFIEFPRVQYIGNDKRLRKDKIYVVLSEVVYDNITYYTLMGISGQYNSSNFYKS